MLKFLEVNPLNVFGLRRTEHCPPHFQDIKFDLRTSEKELADWIYEHLQGRFYIGDHYSPKEQGGLIMCKKVAFEIPAELTYFAMFLDTINKPYYE
jgi:hypothetical protein